MNVTIRELPTLAERGRQYFWFDLEDRYLPLIEEGEAPPTAEHYGRAEQLTETARTLGNLRDGVDK